MLTHTRKLHKLKYASHKHAHATRSTVLQTRTPETHTTQNTGAQQYRVQKYTYLCFRQLVPLLHGMVHQHLSPDQLNLCEKEQKKYQYLLIQLHIKTTTYTMLHTNALHRPHTNLCMDTLNYTYKYLPAWGCIGAGGIPLPAGRPIPGPPLEPDAELPAEWRSCKNIFCLMHTGIMGYYVTGRKVTCCAYIHMAHTTFFPVC